MRVGAGRGRAADLRRAVGDREVSLRRAQKDDGARDQELSGRRIDRGLKRGPDRSA